MNYRDGREVRVGDRVKLGKEKGVVVGSVDTDDYAPDFPREEWAFLKRGVLIEFTCYGLLHYEELEEDLELVERGERQP